MRMDDSHHDQGCEEDAFNETRTREAPEGEEDDVV